MGEDGFLTYNFTYNPQSPSNSVNERFCVVSPYSTAKDSARDLVRQFMDSRTPLGETCVEVRDGQGRVVAALTVAEVLEHPVHPAFKQNCAESPRTGHR